jgi:hypothetical protein
LLNHCKEKSLQAETRMLHSGDLAPKVLIGNGLAIGRRTILGPLVANTNYLVVSVAGVIKQLLNY